MTHDGNLQNVRFKQSVGVEFNAPDKLPVNLFFVIIAPKDETANYLQLLSQIASFLNIDKIRTDLMAAKSPQEFLDIVKKNERR